MTVDMLDALMVDLWVDKKDEQRVVRLVDKKVEPTVALTVFCWVGK
jgi:hypothetical protein